MCVAGSLGKAQQGKITVVEKYKKYRTKVLYFLLRSISDKQAGGQYYFSGRRGKRGYLEHMNEKS
jgi:hypothetical protein